MNRTILLAALALGTLGCAKHADPVRKYDASLLQLASAFSAKEVCSCVFVTGRDPASCADWTRVNPEVAKFKIDTDKREVRARSLGMGKTTARYVDEQTGCIIVDPAATP